jgi:hypothetical protein
MDQFPYRLPSDFRKQGQNGREVISDFRVSTEECRTTSAWLFIRFSDTRPRWETKGGISVFRMRKDGCCTSFQPGVPSDFRITGQSGPGVISEFRMHSKYRTTSPGASFRFSDMRPKYGRGEESFPDFGGTTNAVPLLLGGFHPIFGYEAKMRKRDHFRFSDGMDGCTHFSFLRFSDMRPKGTIVHFRISDERMDAGPFLPGFLPIFGSEAKIWTGRGVISEFRMSKDGCCTTVARLPSDFRIWIQGARFCQGFRPIFGYEAKINKMGEGPFPDFG